MIPSHGVRPEGGDAGAGDHEGARRALPRRRTPRTRSARRSKLRSARRAGSSTGPGTITEGDVSSASAVLTLEDDACSRLRRTARSATFTCTVRFASTATRVSPRSSRSSRASSELGDTRQPRSWSQMRKVNVIGVGMTKFQKPGASDEVQRDGGECGEGRARRREGRLQEVQSFVGYVWRLDLRSACGLRARPHGIPCST